MSDVDIKQKEHDAWWRGFKVGSQNSIDVVKRQLTENPQMKLSDLIVRMKVSALNMRGESDERC